jgi:hypothetical protein
MKNQQTFKKKFFHTIKNYYIISKKNQMNQDKKEETKPTHRGREGDPLLFSEHHWSLLPHPMF